MEHKEHPLPWRVDQVVGRNSAIVVDARGGIVLTGGYPEEYNYIVRCVNHAERLAEALRDLLFDVGELVMAEEAYNAGAAAMREKMRAEIEDLRAQLAKKDAEIASLIANSGEGKDGEGFSRNESGD